MPRKSAASHAFPVIPGSPQRLRPPPELKGPARRIFIDLVASTEPTHFRASDLPLLCAYARAVQIEQSSANDSKAIGRWSQAVKAMAVLTTRLRLSPQAREPNRPTRPTKPHVVSSYYDRNEDE